jgi:hypothetical protein
MGLRGKRGRARSWRRLVDMAAPAPVPPERRVISVGPGEAIDPDQKARLLAAGFHLEHVAKCGWAGGEFGRHFYFERQARSAPPPPIRRRK